MTRTARPKTKPPKSPSRPPANAAESPGAELVTVVWMLSVLLTTATELLAVVANLLVHRDPTYAPYPLLAGMLFFAAVVLSTVSLILLAVVWWARRQPPPTPVTVFALTVALAPWILVLAKSS